MNLKILGLITITGLTVSACGPRQPAYKNINTNQSAQQADQDPGGTAGKLTPDNMNAMPSTGGEASPPAALPPPAFRMPRFMDTAKGHPKDLPNYPLATPVNVQYGPNGDIDTFSASLSTGDPMDKIVAFYDKVVKSNGWTVSNRIVDPEYSEWALKKAETEEAKVRVQKDKQSSRLFIIIARTSKSPQPSPAAPTPPQS